MIIGCDVIIVWYYHCDQTDRYGNYDINAIIIKNQQQENLMIGYQLRKSSRMCQNQCWNVHQADIGWTIDCKTLLQVSHTWKPKTYFSFLWFFKHNDNSSLFHNYNFDHQQPLGSILLKMQRHWYYITSLWWYNWRKAVVGLTKILCRCKNMIIIFSK